MVPEIWELTADVAKWTQGAAISQLDPGPKDKTLGPILLDRKCGQVNGRELHYSDFYNFAASLCSTPVIS